MDYQNHVSTLFRLFAFVCLVSCNSRYAETNECTIEEHFGHYRIKSDKISIKGLQRIDLSKVWDKADDFEYEYLGINYRDTGYVYFDIVNFIYSLSFNCFYILNYSIIGKKFAGTKEKYL